MQFPRPVSPLSLEVHSPPPADLGIDGVLGSDDELDDFGRVAKRRRVEKLAEAYLQGSPLFILSASLSGPFDEKWVNPWRKDRGRNSTSNCQLMQKRRHGSLHTGTETSSSKTAVIQETDPRRRRRYDDSVEKARIEAWNERAQTVGLGSDITAGRDHDHGNSGHSWVDLGPSECSRLSKDGERRRSKKLKKSIHRANESRYHTPATKEEHSSWLKKARSRNGILDLEPPSSPSAAVPTRQLDIKSRRKVDVSSAMGPSSAIRRSSQISLLTDENRSSHSPVDKQRRTHSSGSILANKPPLASKPASPAERQRIPHSPSLVMQSSTSNSQPSHHVASSSSHLPRFEYRRSKTRVPASGSPAVTNQEENVNEPNAIEEPKKPDPEKPDPKKPDPLIPTSPKEPSMHNTESNSRPTEQGIPHFHSNSSAPQGPKPKENRSVSFLGESKPPSYSTSEKMPSAQQVPGNANLADFVVSLHSTEAPKDNSDYNEDTNPDAQFSTQAAVLLAQKSFQNDLESPERNPASASDKRYPPPSHSSRSQAITPFSRVNTSRKSVDDDRPKESARNDSQVMSTQHMIAAVSPFTFSTEKKRNRHLGVPPNSTEYSSKKKRKKTSSRSTPTSGNSLLSPEKHERPEATADVHPESFEPGDHAGTQTEPDQAFHANNDGDGSHSQMTALPLTLTGSTPPTAQADPGDLGSFNLREAIADAGSWLQQSFDFTRDLGARSDRSGPSSSVAARHSALNLDPIN